MILRRLAPVLLALAAATAPRPVRAQVPEDTLRVPVAGPTVVAFFPPVTQAEVDADDELAAVLDDFTWHLSSAARALREAGVAVHVRFAAAVRLRDAGTEREFVPGGEMRGVGYLLVLPGRAPRMLRGVMTDIDLLSAAADYFGRPAIVPGEGKRDG
jgi:hypothetical protein